MDVCMSLIQEIKQHHLVCRKHRYLVKSRILGTLIGEAEMIGKNDGNRETTDAEVIAIIKKFIKNIDESIKVCQDVNSEWYDEICEEKDTISDYLPKQLNEQELTDVINQLISGWPISISFGIGNLLSRLKLKYNGCYDGAMAAKLVKDIFGQSRMKLV